MPNPLACRLKCIERRRAFVAGNAYAGGDSRSLFEHGANSADCGSRQKQRSRICLGRSSKGGKAIRHGAVEYLQLGPAAWQVQACGDMAHFAIRERPNPLGHCQDRLVHIDRPDFHCHALGVVDVP
ncbi:hypothetical protein NKH37_26095 [Mesorhizobium sp. M1217]|uniref:hypothetical protein n=1 Tax=Mesorhizobium sp. M1217 TaxID=2957070 RepID=UPI00333A1090